METILIGIDGLDPDLFERWREDLPTLAGLADRGAVGRLRSSDPPFTSPAWPTFYTGKQGGKHGVFGFTKAVDDSYRREPITFKDVRSEALWEVLDDAGVRSGIVNVPFTHPPSDLSNGFVVSGWPVPRDAEPASPPSVRKDLEDDLREPYEVNPFPLTVEFDQLDDDTLLESITDGLWHHQRAFESLLTNNEVDVFFCVFMAIDVASHSFAWSPEHLRDVYIEQDRAIEALLDSVPDGTNIVIVSDHGHGAKGSHSFHVNEWLARNGYLSRTEEEGDSLLSRIGVTQANYVRAKNAMGLGDVHESLPTPLYRFLRRVIPTDAGGGREFDPEAIDWSDTTAFSAVQNEVFLNTDRYPEGTLAGPAVDREREQLIEDLAAIDHPEQQKRLMTSIRSRDELFEGPYIERAPDVVFVADGMECNAPMSFADGEIFTDEQWGEHRQYGVLLTAGPSFESLDSDIDRDIKDVFPLVATLSNAAIPSDIDGSIPTTRLAGPMEPSFREPRNRGDSGEYSDDRSEDARDVRDQLEGLGYLE